MASFFVRSYRDNFTTRDRVPCVDELTPLILRLTLSVFKVGSSNAIRPLWTHDTQPWR